jgi:hypothetical protein
LQAWPQELYSRRFIAVKGGHMEQLALYPDESYDRNKDKKYYCICGLLLSSQERNRLDHLVRSLKKDTWGSDYNNIEIKGRYIFGWDTTLSPRKRRKQDDSAERFSSLREKQLDIFLRTLSNILFDGDTPIRIFPLLMDPRTIRLTKQIISSAKQLRPEHFIYFLYISQANAFFKKNNVKGSLVFDEGDEDIRKLFQQLKEKQPLLAFDLVGAADMISYEKSRDQSAIQIADFCAYTYTILEQQWLTGNLTCGSEVHHSFPDGILWSRWLPHLLGQLKKHSLKKAKDCSIILPINWAEVRSAS